MLKFPHYNLLEIWGTVNRIAMSKQGSQGWSMPLNPRLC